MIEDDAPSLEQWILNAAEGQNVEAVVIGEMGWGDYNSENVPNYDKCPKGVVLKWEDALPFLKYKFYHGYGSPGCQAIYAWTKSWVIFIAQYDGATSPHRVPRNPIDIMPTMPGG